MKDTDCAIKRNGMIQFHGVVSIFNFREQPHGYRKLLRHLGLSKCRQAPHWTGQASALLGEDT